MDDICIELLRTHKATERNVFQMASQLAGIEVGLILRMPGVNVLVVDTCGDFKGDLFGHRSTWKTSVFESNQFPTLVWDDYVAGSLYEILTRKGDYFLNPTIEGGYKKCINIHKKKMETLYPNKYRISVPTATITAALDYLKPLHERYMTWLSQQDAQRNLTEFVKSL
jgi:hypothetical protein